MTKLDTGRKNAHSALIDHKSLNDKCSVDNSHRFFLNFKYERGLTECASIILMNPSSASKEHADTTIRRVQDCLKSDNFFPDLKEVYILNLFTIRGKNPGDINSVFLNNNKNIDKLIGPDHDQIVKKIINKSKFVIVAWGGPCGIDLELHTLRVKAMHELIADKEIYRICGGKYKETSPYPLHGRIWNTKLRPVRYNF